MMAVEAGGLTKSFDGRRRALDEVGLELARGEMVALIGASGSGKSTLIRSISSLACCDAGEVEVFGERVQEGGRLTRRAAARSAATSASSSSSSIWSAACRCSPTC